MRSFIWAFLLGAALFSVGASAQGPSSGPGPGPSPDPWFVSGPTISYSQGGITAPQLVTGGSMGVGTFNANGFYVGGVPIYGPNLFALNGLTGANGLIPQFTGVGTMHTVSSATTVNGQSCALGSTCTVSASAASVTPGSTTVVSGTSNGLLYDAAGVLGNLATANNGVLVTSSGGAPSISTTLPSGLSATSMALMTPVLSGTATGTYTLGGTPTIASPALSGTVTGTYTLGGTPTITAPTLSGTVGGTYTLGSGATWNGAAIGTQFGGLGANNSAATGIPVFASGVATVSATIPSTSVTNTSVLAGAVSRSLQSKLGDVINIKDFGAVCDGAHATADTAAMNAAYSALLTNSDSRGGIIVLPRGTCNFTNTMAAGAFDNLVNLYVVGQGWAATVVNFAGEAAGQDGFTFAHGSSFGLSDMLIENATRDCISVNPGDAISGGANAAHYQFARLRVQFCGRDGRREVNSFLGTNEDSWYNANTGWGVNYLGGHTTEVMRRVFAASNGAGGQFFNGMISSTIIGGSSDSNTGFGYQFTNIHGMTVQNTDCEQNTNSCMFVNQAPSTGLPSSYVGTYGLSFENNFGFDNSFGAVGTNAGLFTFSPGAAGANISVSGCTYFDDQGGSPVAIGYNATGGALAVRSINCNNLTGGVNTFGSPVVTTDNAGSFTPGSGIVGRTGGSDPAAGFVGTTLTTTAVNCTTTTGLTSGTAANVASLSVPAGNWDIEGIAGVAPAATTVLQLVSGGISTTSGAFGVTNGGLGRFQTTPGSLTGNSYEQTTGKRHFNFTTTTTVFLVVSATFTTSTAGSCGQMIATQTP